MFDPDGNPVLGRDGKPKLHWTKPARTPLTFDEDEEWYACPKQDVKENPHYWARLFKFYALFKKGYLPQAGGAVDQSNRAIELLTLIDSVNDECGEELADQRRVAAAHQARAAQEHGHGGRR